MAGKVQQCLVTGSKWNKCVTDTELKSRCTHLDAILVHCVPIYNVELSQHDASIEKVLQMWSIYFCYKQTETCNLVHILLQTCQENIYYFERHHNQVFNQSIFHSIVHSVFQTSLPFSNTHVYTPADVWMVSP